jgi:hypothetical protein
MRLAGAWPGIDEDPGVGWLEKRVVLVFSGFGVGRFDERWSVGRL